MRIFLVLILICFCAGEAQGSPLRRAQKAKEESGDKPPACRPDADDLFNGEVRVVKKGSVNCFCRDGAPWKFKKTSTVSTACLLEIEPVAPVRFNASRTKVGFARDPEICRLKPGEKAKLGLTFECRDSNSLPPPLPDCESGDVPNGKTCLDLYNPALVLIFNFDKVMGKK